MKTTKTRPGQKIKLTSVQELLGVSNEETALDLEVEKIRSFKNHPFKVVDDEKMQDLVESIRVNGILSPVLVRPIGNDIYEMVSGHRRMHAAIILGMEKIPAIIREMTDDEAIVKMVDANIQREELLPSEKAFAIKMKYDAMKRKSGRRKKGQIDYQTKGKKTVEILGEESGDSPKQVQRYLKITELIPELLNYLDEQRLSFNPAFEIAFLKEEEQRIVLSAIEYTQSMPSLSQAQRIKKLGQAGSLNEEKVRDILSEVKKGEIHRVTFKNEQFYTFFPKTDSAETMKRKIIEILKLWRAERIND